MKKIIKNIIAVIFLLIGIICGFLPFLQGWVFVLIGFIMLDFKKKEFLEQKIILWLNKYKLTKKLAELWGKVKSLNKDVIDKDKNKNIKNIYKDIKSRDNILKD